MEMRIAAAAVGGGKKSLFFQLKFCSRSGTVDGSKGLG